MNRSAVLIKVAFCCARPKCRTIIHITAAMNLRGICTKLKSIVNVIWYCENHNMYWKCIFKTSSDFVWQFHTRQQGRPIDNIHISHDFEGDIHVPEYQPRGDRKALARYICNTMPKAVLCELGLPAKPPGYLNGQHRTRDVTSNQLSIQTIQTLLF